MEVTGWMENKSRVVWEWEVNGGSSKTLQKTRRGKIQWNFGFLANLFHVGMPMISLPRFDCVSLFWIWISLNFRISLKFLR